MSQSPKLPKKVAAGAILHSQFRQLLGLFPRYSDPGIRITDEKVLDISGARRPTYQTKVTELSSKGRTWQAIRSIRQTAQAVLGPTSEILSFFTTTERSALTPSLLSVF